MTDEQSELLADLPPAEMQQYLDNWDNTRYAFHWSDNPILPLLQAHHKHLQDAMRWGWEGLMAGTDGSVNECTECLGAVYVHCEDRVPLMILSSLFVVLWCQFVLKQLAYSNSC